VQAEGGVNVASREWLHEVQDLAKEVGALFIIDDIQAAVGRTGGYFSFDGMDLDPDIIALAKGLGGYGTPIAMTLNKPEVDAHWSPGAHTGTFRGQGLSFVAGTVALDYFTDEAFLADVLAKGETMRDRLVAIRDAHPDRGWAVRRRGMMQALDTGEGPFAKRLQPESYDRGLLIGPCGRRGRERRLMRRREDMTCPPQEYERRVRELRERMAARQLDAVIISDPENLMYLTDHQTTGYSFFQALIVPLEADPVMITRALEESNVIARTWLENSRGYPDTGDAILELVSTLRDLRLGDSRVGYERNSYYFPAYQQDRFHDAFGEGLVDCFGIVEEGRIRKSPDEIEVMQLA